MIEDLISSLIIMKFFGVRAFISILAGFIIGVERTMTNHSAGIKTLVFVSLGSCMFSALSFYLHDLYPSSDPTRIIGQIITGVGFLGAGVIFMNQSQSKLSGLTSSAVIWFACSLGVMAGAGLFMVPICASVTMVVIMYVLRKIEKFFEPNDDATQ